MTRRRGDLDRAGLFQSILGDLTVEPASGAGIEVELSQLTFNPDQPRKHFEAKGLEQLAASISQHGVLEPILVRRSAAGFELIAGERRSRAAELAGLASIPAIVLDVEPDDALEISIMENLQREDLNAVEETDAVLHLLQLHLKLERDEVISLLQGIYNEGRGREQTGSEAEAAIREQARNIFARLGRFTASSFYVNRVPILSFPAELLEAVRAGQLSFTKAQLIARLPEKQQRVALLEQALEEDLSVTELRSRVAKLRARDGTERHQQSTDLTAVRRLLNKGHLERLTPRQRNRADALLRELRELLEK